MESCNNASQYKWIPAALATILNVQNLKSLNIAENYLVTLPEEIHQLQYLTHLNISNNKLKELPSTIGQLNNLKTLDLEGNKLENIPKDITNIYLNKLKLDISHINNLEISIKQWLKAIRQRGGSVEIINSINESGNELYDTKTFSF